ncbi:MAG: glyoxylate/hydroxypyruvate reductase A [Burkholderiales bacterium]
MTILVAAAFDADEWRAWWPLLEAALSGEHLVRDRGECDASEIDIALVANPPAGALKGLPALQLIQSLWAGVDRLLADASVPAQVPLARMVDPAMNQAMAETALWAVLSLQRDFFVYAAQQHAGEWRQHALRCADDLSIAILGLGQMGSTAAQLLTRHGYRVTGWRTHDGAAALPRILAGADIVINLLPLTAATRGLFGAATFAQMRRGASLVNLARGAHVVDADLLDALDRGQLEHAVLDVFDAEPLPPGHAFWAHPRVTVLPHVAAPTDPRSAAPIAAANVLALRAGRPIAHLVSRERGY